MIKKLILVGVLLSSAGVHADLYNDYQQRQYQQEMLRQQQEQTRIMQQQAAQDYNAMADQKMYQDNQIRNQLYGNRSNRLF